MNATLESVTDSSYVAGLEMQDLQALRAKRQTCEAIENGLSYARRLVHGRLDIVRSELRARRAGHDPAALDDIIGRLPDLLADAPSVHRSGEPAPAPRPPQDMVPGSYGESLVDELEMVFPVSAISGLASAGVRELAELGDALASFEGRLSNGRRSLHAVIDALQGEIIRRYQDGDASVDSLLQ